MSIFPLKNMPMDIKKYILKVQGEMKVKKGLSRYSQELTIYKIIKEHMEFMNKKDN